MISPINGISQQEFRTSEVKTSTLKNEVEISQVKSTETSKTNEVAPKPVEPVKEKSETKFAEQKEKQSMDNAQALRTLAAQEQVPNTKTPNNNLVSADSVIVAYKQ